MATKKTTKKAAVKKEADEKEIDAVEGDEKINETEPAEPKEFKEGTVPLEDAEEEDFDPKKITSDEGEDEQDAYYGADEDDSTQPETDEDDFLPEEFKENNW